MYLDRREMVCLMFPLSPQESDNILYVMVEQLSVGVLPLF